MFTNALRSKTSSTERSPTSSTLTMLPLLPLLFIEGFVATSKTGSLTVVERLIVSGSWFALPTVISTNLSSVSGCNAKPNNLTWLAAKYGVLRVPNLYENFISTQELVMLLHWCTLKPFGPSNLAAVRFTSPIRLHSICIFPTGARPFTHCPDVVAYVAAINTEYIHIDGCTDSEQLYRAWCFLS